LPGSEIQIKSALLYLHESSIIQIKEGPTWARERKTTSGAKAAENLSFD